MILIVVLLRLTMPLVSAQEPYRIEAGVQLARLDLTPLGESPLGAGGRLGYFVNRFVVMEAEANRYFEDPSHNFGHTQVMAGGRVGLQFGPVGIYAKVRPGWLHLGGAAASRNPGREDHFCLDLGGVIVVGREERRCASTPATT